MADRQLVVIFRKVGSEVFNMSKTLFKPKYFEFSSIHSLP